VEWIGKQSQEEPFGENETLRICKGTDIGISNGAGTVKRDAIERQGESHLNKKKGKSHNQKGMNQ